jgi:large subunit ribosomal protein L28
MSRVCELTGISPSYGNKVSHSNIKTRTRWNPNLRAKKYLVSELQQSISLLLSTRAIRTIDKLGSISTAIMKAKDGDLSERLQKIKRSIYRSRVNAAASGKGTKVKAAKKVAAPVTAAEKAPAKKAAPKAAKKPTKKA